MSESGADDVNDGDDDNPDRVHEMPIPGNHLDVLGVVCGDLAQQAEDEDEGQEKKPDDHMARMEPDERVERGAEDVRRQGEVVLVDEVLPLRPGKPEEVSSERDRDRPPQVE